MTKRKNKQTSELHSDSDGEVPNTKNKKMETSAESKLEPHLANPELTLAGLSLDEYMDLHDLLYQFGDKRSISKYLHVFEYISSQMKNRIAEIRLEKQNSNKIETIESNLNKMNNNLESMNIEMHKMSKALTPRNVFQAPLKPISYAQATSSLPVMNQHQNQPNQLKTIILKSNSDSTTPTIMDVKVKKIINETKTKAKIVNIKTTKSSVIINSAENDNKVIECLVNKINEHHFNSNSFKAYIPKKKDPTIVIKGVSIDNNVTTVVNQIKENNSEFENVDDINNKIKFLFKMKKKNPKFMDLVLRVSPDIYQIINQRMRNKIYIDFQYCDTEHRIFVKQCQNCYEYGHKKSECKNSSACRNCGDHWHAEHHCINPNIKNCVNCKKHPSFKNDTNHSPNSDHCPLYIAQMKKIMEQTQFFPDN
ncbi:hypothetical protein SSS_01074 [Sarcoptes scabiei]|uniref:CCHC-type domain-containing protein n=1 Tax=Sarcoptes scabiei TaxID=52283 RepID=A0A834RH06_SARSC|nr:hypothetical protein SSS_01074 [Sarcoptes scabiei]